MTSLDVRCQCSVHLRSLRDELASIGMVENIVGHASPFRYWSSVTEDAVYGARPYHTTTNFSYSTTSSSVSETVNNWWQHAGPDAAQGVNDATGKHAYDAASSTSSTGIYFLFFFSWKFFPFSNLERTKPGPPELYVWCSTSRARRSINPKVVGSNPTPVKVFGL